MNNSGVCPGCRKALTHVRIEEVRFCIGNDPDGKGLSFICPECRVVISVSFDPSQWSKPLRIERAQRAPGKPAKGKEKRPAHPSLPLGPGVPFTYTYSQLSSRGAIMDARGLCC